MDEPTLTFAELERRVGRIPDGPASILNTPRWLYVFNAIGMAGIVLGLLPGLLIDFMPPAPWMAVMARGGLFIAIAGFALPFLRSVLVFAASFTHWKRDQALQLDHDLVELRQLQGWIGTQPPEHVAELREFCRQTRERLAEKLAMLGGVEKLGLLPILVGVALHARAVMESIRTSSWEAPVGMFLVLLYGITFVGNLMRQRLRLYETLLERKSAPRGP